MFLICSLEDKMIRIVYFTRNSAIADKPRDAFRGQSRNMVPFRVTYGFLLLCYRNYVRKRHRFFDIRPRKCRDLENRVRGPWRVLKSHLSIESLWLPTDILAMALSCVISEIFNVEKYSDLEIPVRGQSRSLKVVQFHRLGMISY